MERQSERRQDVAGTFIGARGVRIALELVAQTPAGELPELEAEQLRADLLEEQWGAAVERWVRCTDAWLDVYESWDLHRAADAELAPAELQFTPLFRTG